ncbi:flavin reductase family protein [Arthrobacter sp. ok362]|uniref:flavin reductase family protein n=1 Tax=Arthrobacter sp. ok362 TaxID=1761745 RepID=UPI001587FDBE|nr:flavin reductase family protein [Arthrobacter sp. ok362]
MTAHDLRSVMGHWTTGVCVVTTEVSGRQAGLVMNSFASVSLDPALVSWCVDRSSTNFGTWLETDNFSVHILDQARSHHVPRFTRRGADKFEGLKTTTGTTGAPALTDVAARLDCRIWARYDGGDHIILVGEVDHIARPQAFEPLLSQDLRRP